MKNRFINCLATIAMILTLTACGGGSNGSSGVSGGGLYPGTATGKLADSGQTKCYYDYLSDFYYMPTESTCLAPGSGWSPDGQDGNYTINAMSFSDKGDGTILDNVTGLNWQKCALGESGNDCMGGTTASYSWSAAKNQCAQLGTGWRLPTVFELSGIVNYGISSGTIDATAFPGAVGMSFWTTTPHPLYTTMAWLVNFTQGNTEIDYQTNMNYVRCVRG